MFLIFAVLINLPFFSNMPLSKAVRESTLFIFSPFISAANSLLESPKNAIRNIAALRRVQKENDLLRSKIDAMSAKSQSFDGLLKDNEELRQLAQFKGSNPFKRSMAAAQVISRSGSSWFNTVLLDKGRGEGIRSGMAVVNTQGLVGRTIEVAPHSSKVLLISDPDSSVSASVARSKALGVVIGNLSNVLEMKYIISSSSIEAGDPIVTSGVSDMFPKGIPVGAVIKADKRDYALFQYIEIKTSADLTKLDKVFILY
ncbi:MAG: rod shape-determining protein MreC [Candidatus Margulisiibacteriota bacterium]